jgi:high-affinity nickel-transport protein
MSLLQRLRTPELTIFGRSLLLVTLELSTNAFLWVMAGILFGKNDNTRPILNLALLAWVCILDLLVSLQSLSEIPRLLV